MRHILTSVFLIVLLFPALAFGEMVESYYDNGQLRFKGSYKDGEYDGPFIVYHQNGQLEFKGSYKDRNLHGLWVTYFENGQLHFKGSYKDGREEGLWVGYNEDGTVWELMTGTYENGVKISN